MLAGIFFLGIESEFWMHAPLSSFPEGEAWGSIASACSITSLLEQQATQLSLVVQDLCDI